MYLPRTAGTQTIDRVWLNLKIWLPCKLQAVEKKDGHHFVNKEMKRMMLQWTWHRTVFPCSPKDMMTHLVKLLERHDRWIPFCKKGIVWGHVKNYKKSMLFPMAGRYETTFPNGRAMFTGRSGRKMPWAVDLVHMSLKEAIHPQLEGHSRHFKTKQEWSWQNMAAKPWISALI